MNILIIGLILIVAFKYTKEFFFAVIGGTTLFLTAWGLLIIIGFIAMNWALVVQFFITTLFLFIIGAFIAAYYKGKQLKAHHTQS